VFLAKKFAGTDLFPGLLARVSQNQLYYALQWGKKSRQDSP